MRTRNVVLGIVAGLVMFNLLGQLRPAAKCRDGWASPSIGLRGACSHHGGVKRHEWFALFLLLVSGGAGFYTANKLQAWSDRRKGVPPPAQASGPVDHAGSDTNASPQSPSPSNDHPPCPVCGAQMSVRRAKRGRSKGKTFLGCSSYPRCRGTRPLRHAP